MTTNATSPTAQRWELARRLKELRVEHVRSLDDVARELMCSTAKVSRMETGARGIQRRDVRDLCRFYAVSAEVEQELMALATEAGRSGWWSGFRTLDDDTAQFVGLESAAVEVWTTNALLVPGLLQTPAYTTHLLRGLLMPLGELSEAAVLERVEVRQHRQARVTSGQLQLRALVDEGTLRRPIAPPDVMAEQIDHLIDRAAEPNVHVQIVPYSVGAHPGMYGNFQFMRFAPDTVADVVFVEGLLGMFLIDKSLDTERYRTVFEDISSTWALPPNESLDWLRDIREHILR